MVTLTPDNIIEVCKLIDKYNVPDCMPFCERFLQNTVTPERVIQYYDVALLFRSPGLCQSLLHFIGQNCREVFTSVGFLQCSENILKHILFLDSLNCKEITVFEGAMNWATQSLMSRGQKVTDENIRKELGDGFNLIRFPCLNMDEFITCVEKHRNLLHFEEYMDILHYLASRRPLTAAKHFDDWPRGHPGLRLHSRKIFKLCPSFLIILF